MTNPGFGKGLKIVELGELIQSTIVAHYAAAAVDLPTRQYFVPGDPAQIAWDCEQFTVGLAGVGWGWAEDAQPISSPATGAQAFISLRHAIFNVQIVRCTASSARDGRPNAAEIHDSGKKAFRDAGLLSQALVQSVKEINQQITKNAGKAQAGVIVPIGPEGNYHAVAGTLSVTAGLLE